MMFIVPLRGGSSVDDVYRSPAGGSSLDDVYRSPAGGVVTR